jgi:trehalose 6-phosphate phosphatase
LKHLLSSWLEVAEQIRNAKRILFLTDFDGTLTPIVERPELANISENTRNLLESLSHNRHFKVGIISGRALADLKDKINIKGIIYAGNHGLEVEGPGLNFVNPIAEEIKPFFRVIHKVLSMAFGTTRGVLVENKGLTLSVHYRQIDDTQSGEVKNIFDRVINGAQAIGQVKVTTGKKVYEIRPAVDWDKGEAIRMLMKRYGKGGRNSGLLPIYLGDDLTDEDGFKFIEKYGDGISVFVGENNSNTSARFYLRSVEEVAIFLENVLNFARRGLK